MVRQVVSLFLQLLLFVLFFRFFGLPLIHKYEENQVISSGQIDADTYADAASDADADAAGDGAEL